MEKIKSIPGLITHFRSQPNEVQGYFEHLPRLVNEFPLDVALAYVFSQVERAQVSALYCGVVKLHQADGELAWKAINAHHMTRGEFRAKYETVYGQPIPEPIAKLITLSEAVRDRVMHGKAADDPDKRNAIAHALSYANALNALTVSLGGPKPFGDLRGFKGRAQSLDKSTSRWILRGMGFGPKGKEQVVESW